MSNFLNNHKIVKVKAASAAGQTEVNSDVVDLTGYKGVTFITTAGVIAATGVQSMKVEQGSASDLSDASDVTGASHSIADDDDNQTFAIEHSEPTERYARCTLERATANSAFGEIYAILHDFDKEPVTQDVTDVLTSKRVHEAGTA